MSVLSDFQPLVAIVGSVIAYFIYRLSCLNRDDAWARQQREFHQFFWTSKEFEEVRMWLACDESYCKVEHVFTRRIKENIVTHDDYHILEKMDKFCALMISYNMLQPSNRKLQRLNERMYDMYWVSALNSEERSAIRDYIRKFYPELIQEASELPQNYQLG